MDYSTALLISSVGMSIERTRVDITALNLANANTVQNADGSVYAPATVLVRSPSAGNVVAPGSSNSHSPAGAGAGPIHDFARMLESGDAGPNAYAGHEARDTGLLGLLPQVQIVQNLGQSRLVHEPGHPLADEHGFVRQTKVDLATETFTLMSATRAYEANLGAFNSSRGMALRALEIGRGN
jgi:flagellar basal-body rod protein FlgC